MARVCVEGRPTLAIATLCPRCDEHRDDVLNNMKFKVGVFGWLFPVPKSELSGDEEEIVAYGCGC